MPQFYFDIGDNGETVVDDEGREFASEGDAQAEAMKSLGEMARDCANDQRPLELSITVRDDGGTVFGASFEIKILVID